ncbi:MAG TPA: 8-oxo-dGTP diphosphatase [Actinocrinis sp.]|nr:8-oxo-dGTP diphosphatase [Actinocrinis sp.]
MTSNAVPGPSATPSPTPAPTSLCLLTRPLGGGRREVLLGLKKTGFGLGKIVGPGGHVEPGESAAQAAVREVHEEVGLHVGLGELRELGHVTFRFPTRPDWDLGVAVFGAEWTGGEPVESAELAPRWYPVDRLPLDRMWDDARFWLPEMLSGRRVYAQISYSADGRTVHEVRIDEVRPEPVQGTAAGQGDEAGEARRSD